MPQGFELVTDMQPRGDQPQAIEGLVAGVRRADRAQTLLGVTGSGKSVTSDTPIFVRTRTHALVRPIGPMVDGLMAAREQDIIRHEETEILALDEGALEAFSFDAGSGDVGWRPVRQLLRHRAPRHLWKLRTACGREVIVTEDHNFFVLREGRLQLIPTTEIRKGDYLPLPPHLPEPILPLEELSLRDFLDARRSIYVSMPDFHEVWRTDHLALRPVLTTARASGVHRGERVSIAMYRRLAALSPALERGARFGTIKRRIETSEFIPLTDRFLRVVGYYVAEGHAAPQFFSISSADAEIVDEVRAEAASLGIRVHHPSRGYDYHLMSSLWSDLLSTWCGRRAKSKRLPPFWPQLSNRHLAQLLSGYFSADGGVDGDEISCVTACRDLASDVSYALLRFGIVARSHPRRMRLPGREERRTYWTVRISGQPDLRRFQESIGFVLPHKRFRLAAIAGRSANTNVDVIPLGGDAIRRVRRELGLSQLQLAEALFCTRSMLSLIENGYRNPSRALAGRLVTVLAEEAGVQGRADIADVVDGMRILLNFVWSPTQSLEAVPGEGFVYDLSVADHETFLAGQGGLFVHNTYTMARVIEQIQKPTLVLAHNKTLAAQLYSEFRDFFPKNAVRYFVSYYDYYQPEAYVPQTDLYIAKDASINDEIDRLRHASTKALMERSDVIVVASVSCIYGLGRPEDYKEVMVLVRKGERRSREEILRGLVDIQYERNDIDFARGRFRVRGDVIEVHPAYEDRAVRIELFGDVVDRIMELNPVSGEVFEEKSAVAIWPAKHWVTTDERLERALQTIQEELRERADWFKSQGKLLEAQRLEFRTKYDMELLREVGYCPGIENYSRHLDGRRPGERPGCLLDYFPKDYLMFIDESHVTVPQVHGMLEGDRSRKQNLVEFGFRLPSAFDNRPLAWEEFDGLINQVIFVSATPAAYERQASDQVVEQIVRPTGLVDPQVEVRTAKGQIDDLIAEIKAQVEKSERTLVTTLTKRMAEDLTAYLQEMGLKVHYLHAEVQTLDRVQILKDLRLGTYDVLVGINLLREGLDLPEVSLVAILDADREGYLRSETSLIQTMGRAARHLGGRVILYADEVTDSMRRAIAETNRRRDIQVKYNEEHGITPESIVKPIRDLIDLAQVAEELETYQPSEELLTAGELIKLAETQRAKVPWDIARLLMLSPQELEKTIESLEREMRRASANLEFEKAAVLRDQVTELRKGLGEPFFAGARGGRGLPGGTGRGRRGGMGRGRGRYGRR